MSRTGLINLFLVVAVEYHYTSLRHWLAKHENKKIIRLKFRKHCEVVIEKMVHTGYRDYLRNERRIQWWLMLVWGFLLNK